MQLALDSEELYIMSARSRCVDLVERLVKLVQPMGGDL